MTMDSDEGVSLPLFHKHLMVPWNYLGKGDCCGRVEAITDGYYCERCDFFVHKKCSEFTKFIEHPSHTLHTLKLTQSNHKYIQFCDLCGKQIENRFYHCKICEFDIHLHCAKYPPPEVIHVSDKHHHKLTLLKEWIKFDCGAKCGKIGENEFAYKCDKLCDLAFHVDCVWLPPEVKHWLEMNTSKISWIHEHLMVPWNDMRKGDCCERFEAITDGYYCKECDFFVHKKCGDEASEYIQHPSHPGHTFRLRRNGKDCCGLCGRRTLGLSYRCVICRYFDIDLRCAKYPPPDVIDDSETHHHKLTLLKKRINNFDCGAKCGEIDDYTLRWKSYDFSYKCHECDLSFHVDCVWNQPEIVERPLEVNHSYHSLHTLKLLTGQPPEYSDGKCRLCERKVDKQFYHCSSCNFTLDMRCVLHPPPLSLLNFKAHDHQLTLLPRLDSFTCNACGLKGDRSPYACIQCGFMIHQSCLGLPRVININRHQHRISRSSVLGVVNSVCGVCRKKVDWTCGGYSCQRCPDYVVHSKCATRKDVWNGKELEGVPEEIEDTEPYVVIDDNTIQHFSHKEHHLRLNVDGLLCDENKRCNACTHPICLQSFYSCLVCDFILHQNCAESPKKIWHVLHNDRLTLVTSKRRNYFVCIACGDASNGFVYTHGIGITDLDVRCSSISEPFVHPSHPHHPLYLIPRNKAEICTGCNKELYYVLRCIEDGCEFGLCFKCIALPQVVKHRVDDHPLSLCYGEKETSGNCWCDICEKEASLEIWFYTSKDHQATLHIKCVVGNFTGFMPRSTIKYWSDSSELEVVLNHSSTRPFCWWCKLRCIYPIILKWHGTSDIYFCSFDCVAKSETSISKGLQG